MDKLGDEELALVQKLQAKLAENRGTVMALLKEWDTSNDGEVSEQEFVEAVREMKLDFEESVAQALFRTIDKDGSGLVDFDELSELFKLGKQARTAKDFLKQSSTKNKLFMERDAEPQARVDEPEPMDENLGEAEEKMLRRLQDILAANRSTVTNMLRAWDTNGDGQVSEGEFLTAVKKLGSRLGIEKELDEDEAAFAIREREELENVARALFRSVDVDGSGLVDFHEMSQLFKFKRPVRTAEEFLSETKARAKNPNSMALKGGWSNHFTNHMQVHKRKLKEAQEKGSVALQLNEDQYDLVRWLQEKLKQHRWTAATFLRRWDKDKNGQVSVKEFVSGVKDLTLDKDEDGNPVGEQDPEVAKEIFWIMFEDAGRQKFVSYSELHDLLMDEEAFELSEPQAELKKAIKAGMKDKFLSVESFLALMDKNRDGKVSQQGWLNGVRDMTKDEEEHLDAEERETAKAMYEMMLEASAFVGHKEIAKLFDHERQFRDKEELLKESLNKHRVRSKNEEAIPFKLGWESSLHKKSHNKSIKGLPFGSRSSRDNYSGWVAQHIHKSTANHLGPGTYPRMEDGDSSLNLSGETLDLAKKLQAKLTSSRASVRTFWKRPYDIHGVRVVRIEAWVDKGTKDVNAIAFHMSDRSQRHYGNLGDSGRRQDFAFDDGEYLQEVEQFPTGNGLGAMGFRTSRGRYRSYGNMDGGGEARQSWKVDDPSRHIHGLTMSDDGTQITEEMQTAIEVKTVWRSWGVDREGKVGKAEFVRSVERLTIRRDPDGNPLEAFDRETAEALFDAMDTEGKGFFDFRTIQSLFRTGKPAPRSAQELLRLSSTKFRQRTRTLLG